jgi:hypothetical protein
MQVSSSQLYPEVVSTPNGVPYNVSIRISVPYIGMPITIEKVHLVGKEIFVLSKIGQICMRLCEIDTAEASVAVNLPVGINANDIKVHRYVLGKTWDWSNSSHFGINFIKNENEYPQTEKK